MSGVGSNALTFTPPPAAGATGTWGVPSFMAGKANVAAVVPRVIFVMSLTGSVSVSSSITTSQRQCGERSDGTRGGRCTWRMCAFGLIACAVTSNVPSSMWWHMFVTITSPHGSASINAPQYASSK